MAKCIVCQGDDCDRDMTLYRYHRGDGRLVCICKGCLENINKQINHTEEDSGDVPEVTYDTPGEVFDRISDYVVGQDAAKKKIATAIYNHRMRIHDRTGLIRKSNIILVGDSGSGKTLMAKTIAKTLDVPFCIADATSLTQAGYVGDDVETILSRLLKAADGDIKKAEYGIVYIDEIDKIARCGNNRSITRDVSGEGVQQALLKMVEGYDAIVPVNDNRKNPMGHNVKLNTENILFIIGGAFEGMLTSTVSGGLGFNNSLDSYTEELDVNEDVLIDYGIMPELVGRFPVIVKLDSLTEDALYRILTEPKDSIVKGYQQLFKKMGAELEFTDDALRRIAHNASIKKTGARGLQNIIEDILGDAMFELPAMKGVKKCIVDENAVATKEVKYIYKRERKTA